jgi:large subunit ribosomal protein L24
MGQPGLAIKKNDQVVVTRGRDRGKRGRVLSVQPEKGRVIVEGVNKIKRHTKPNPQRNIKGGIVERETGVSVANVQLVCPECSRPTRVGRQALPADESGKVRRVRYCVKCKGVVDK